MLVNENLPCGHATKFYIRTSERDDWCLACEYEEREGIKYLQEAVGAFLAWYERKPGLFQRLNPAALEAFKQHLAELKKGLEKASQ